MNALAHDRMRVRMMVITVPQQGQCSGVRAFSGG
jgi:hypothetical protein